MNSFKLKLLIQLSILNRGNNYSRDIEEYITMEMSKIKEMATN